MPLDTLHDTFVNRLNKQFNDANAFAVLEHTLCDPKFGRVALVSSFGAEAVVLLHMLSRIDHHTPVLFIDTELLFSETLEYQLEITRLLRLKDVRVIRARQHDLSHADPDNTLHKTAPDQCCDLRKTQPLQNALQDFDTWITGRKRYQNGQRAELPYFEDDGLDRLKINPLIHWSATEVRAYMAEHKLPPHPLVARGYSSIGCAPCTSLTATNEAARAGRWRGSEKQECGIHFAVDGTVRRTPIEETQWS